MASSQQEELIKLEKLYVERFKGAPPEGMLDGISIEEKLAKLQEAIDTGKRLIGEMAFNTFTSLYPLPPKGIPPEGLSPMDADSETRGFQRHVEMANRKGKPRS